MTDKERQKLCAHLRAGRFNRFERAAADEIERLAAENKVLWAALPEGTTIIEKPAGKANPRQA